MAEDGTFVDSHKIFCVLLRWLLERRKWPGEIVRAFNTTRMIDRIAAKLGLVEGSAELFRYRVEDAPSNKTVLDGAIDGGGIRFRLSW